MEKHKSYKDIFIDIIENKSSLNKFNEDIVKELRTKPENAREIIESGLIIAKEQEDKNIYAWCIFWKGVYYHERSDFNSAIEYHLESNNYFIENNMIEGIIRSNNALLADYIRLGMFDLAIEQGLKGIKIAEENNKESAIIPLILNTAAAYLEIEKYQEAIDIINRIKTKNYQFSDECKIVIKVNLAECEIHLGNLEKAYEYSISALRIIEKTDYKVYLSAALPVRAISKYKMGNNEGVIEDFIEAEKFARQFNNIFDLLNILLDMAEYFSTLEQYDKAEQKLLEAIKEGEKVNATTRLKQIYHKLSMIYEKLDRYKESLHAFKKYNEYEKKIYNDNSSVWFAKLHSNIITEEAKVYKELYNDIDIISNIGKRIISELRKSKTLDNIYSEINNLIKTDIFCIALYKEEQKALNYEVFFKKGVKQKNTQIDIKDPNSIGAYCFNNKKHILSNDIFKDYNKYVDRVSCDYTTTPESSRAIIFCPLIVKEKCIGILSVQSYKRNVYTLNDLNKLKVLSSYIAISLENAKLFDEVKYLASHDNLTGAYNRRQVLEIGEKYYDNLSNDRLLGIIMMDIDYFKSINDTYGHSVGDYVLKSITEIVRKELNRDDVIGRYGGEEFLILLPNTNLKITKAIGEKIRASIEAYNFKVDDVDIRQTTTSVGTYTLINNEVSFYEGIKIADTALYEAKREGRNRVVSY